MDCAVPIPLPSYKMAARPHTPVPCHPMLLIFKQDLKGAFERLVQSLTGPQVHVDMVLRVDADSPPALFTSYMFEPFSRNPIDEGYPSKDHVAIHIPLSPFEHRRAVLYLSRCVERKVAYNYPDLVSCVTPGSSLLLRDEPTSPDPPSALFCSQAVVLCLRHALLEGTELHTSIQRLNSRLSTPSVLYNWAKAHGQAVADPAHHIASALPPLKSEEDGKGGEEPFHYASDCTDTTDDHTNNNNHEEGEEEEGVEDEAGNKSIMTLRPAPLTSSPSSFFSSRKTVPAPAQRAAATTTTTTSSSELEEITYWAREEDDNGDQLVVRAGDSESDL